MKINNYQKLSLLAINIQQQLNDGNINIDEAKRLFTTLYEEFKAQEVKDIKDEDVKLLNSFFIHKTKF
ncbi:hypothetical protein [Aquimarina muelleri]|uniref:Uncharacterized protein n=1 Tax=Aquimarina muelleri TaxID=279356 RepID=A0A918JV84_9FLAO|nr:hypothetical protein [Aquimarina muelleri]MCX2765055.1 hypothetical protein [Aquimarina muelleri]GGX19116.1 hypothetical protein GCM10007384_20570 [Aquimarina muelleri]